MRMWPSVETVTRSKQPLAPALPGQWITTGIVGLLGSTGRLTVRPFPEGTKRGRPGPQESDPFVKPSKVSSCVIWLPVEVRNTS